MSRFWSQVNALDKSASDYEGIINEICPFTFETSFQKDDIDIDVIINKPVENDTVYFILNHGIKYGDLSYLLNPRFIEEYDTCHLINRKTNEILGFLMFIDHNINLKGTLLRTGLTTFLTISLKMRHNNLVPHLISNIASFEHTATSTNCGYHFIESPRTPFNIKCQAYFRVIDEKLATEFGYKFSPNQVASHSTSDYSVRVSMFEDLSIILKKSYVLNFQPNFDFYNQYLKFGQSFTVMYKNKVVGVVFLQPILLHIGKVNRICPIGRVVWTEMLPRHSFHVMASIVQYLKDIKKFVVISGIGIGELSDTSLRHQLGMVDTSNMYLDFYNLKLKKYSPRDINLLYI